MIEPEQAANWARYWRPEVQGYIHAYRAVTGVDLAPAGRPRPVDCSAAASCPAGAAYRRRRCDADHRRALPRGPGDGFTGPWDTAAPLGDYLRRCDEAGIDRSNLLAAFHSDYAVANEEVGRIVAGRPGRFYGFAFVHAERDRGRVAR